MPDPRIHERYALARDIAGRAGALALVYWQSRENLSIESKRSPQDIVSEADRAVERQIRAEVSANFPDDGFLGEEYGRTEGTSEFTWLIDPIDGTSSYLHGLPSWCVAITVLRGAETVIGVVSVPTQGEDFSAMLGDGLLVNNTLFRIPDSVTIRNAVTAIGCSQHSDPEISARMVRDLLSAGGVFFNSGSGALMLASVAAGRIAGCLSEYMYAWDCLGGLLMVREAGGHGQVFRADGDYSRPDRVFAAAPGARDDLAPLMKLDPL